MYMDGPTNTMFVLDVVLTVIMDGPDYPRSLLKQHLITIVIMLQKSVYAIKCYEL